MEIKENTKYFVELTRLWEPEPRLIWSGYCEFHIQRRKNGDLGVLAAKSPAPIDWAEYSEEDRDGSGKFICEDYLMEVFAI